jgi:hypothetical protein
VRSTDHVPNGYPGVPVEQIEATLAKSNDLKRVGLTSGIAKAAALLVSPESGWINGELNSPSINLVLIMRPLFVGQVIKLSGGSGT